MPKLKETITLCGIMHEAATYVGGNDGYTIFLTIENISKSFIDVEVEEFYLVQDIERQYDYLYSGYLGREGTILPYSKKTIGRIWLKESLLKSIISENDYVIAIIKDKTHKKKYYIRYDFNGICWENIYFNTRK